MNSVYFMHKKHDLDIFNKRSNLVDSASKIYLFHQERDYNINETNNIDKESNNINQPLKIYDNILSKKKIIEINSFCKKYIWYYGQTSIKNKDKNNIIDDNNARNIYKNHWNKNISFFFFSLNVIENMYMRKLFYEDILPKLDFIQDKNIMITRLYFNTHTLSCPGSFHKDGKPRESLKTNKKQYTVILFVNNDWNINYNGQTAFLINDNLIDTTIYIHSKPGRIIAFDSYVSHKACEIAPYSLLTNKLRFVVAYHLYYPVYNS